MAISPDTSTDREWTVEDYMDLSDDQRYEILEGELLMVPSPNIFHQRSLTSLGAFIEVHVLEHDLGECFDAPFDVVLSPKNVLQPDLTYVRKERLNELYDGHCITGAPDMVIEALSPSTAIRDRHRKRDIYREAGVPWLLLLEPREQVVEVFELQDDGRYALETTAAEDDALNLPLFPELTIDLSKVWFELPEDEETPEEAVDEG